MIALYMDVHVHHKRHTVGQIVADLEILAKVYDPDDMRNRVEYLPF